MRHFIPGRGAHAGRRQVRWLRNRRLRGLEQRARGQGVLRQSVLGWQLMVVVRLAQGRDARCLLARALERGGRRTPGDADATISIRV